MSWLLYALVFVSDALVTLLAAKEQLALQKLSWAAVVWDGLLALAIAINVIGFTLAGPWTIIPSVIGSMVGITGVIWHERRSGSVQLGTSIRVKGFRTGRRSSSGN